MYVFLYTNMYKILFCTYTVHKSTRVKYLYLLKIFLLVQNIRSNNVYLFFFNFFLHTEKKLRKKSSLRKLF